MKHLRVRQVERGESDSTHPAPATARAGRTPSRWRQIPARRVWWAVVLATLAGLGFIVAVVLLVDSGGVRLRSPSGDPEAIVTFAGSFPTEEAELLQNPRGIAWRDGLLYVCDADAGAIYVFEEDGRRVGSYAIPVHPQLSVAYPVGVALLDGGAVAVVDVAGERVLIADGLPRSADPEWESLEDVAGEEAPGSPTAVGGVDSTLYVADDENGTIVAYELDEDFRHWVLDEGESGPSTSSGLYAGRDRLYVSDSNAGRVFELEVVAGDGGDPRGGAARPLPTKFHLPRGVTADDVGRIYVADAFGASVTVLTEDGDPIASIGGGSAEVEIEEDGLPLRPEGIAWSPTTRRLFVTDALRGKVLVYNVELR